MFALQLIFMVVYIVGFYGTIAFLANDENYAVKGDPKFDTFVETAISAVFWPCAMAGVVWVKLCDYFGKEGWY